MSRLTISRCLLLILFSTLSNALFADDYIIELIVFENLNKNTVEEQWLEEPEETSNNTPATVKANWRSASDYQLSNVKAALARSSSYRPLLHVAWLQTVSKKRRAIQLPERNSSASGDSLSGTAVVTRGRYLHLDLDLTLHTAPDTAYIGEDYRFGSPATRIKLQQSRRMRSKELHYIDHPRFGVLALITPVE